LVGVGEVQTDVRGRPRDDRLRAVRQGAGSGSRGRAGEHEAGNDGGSYQVLLGQLLLAADSCRRPGGRVGEPWHGLADRRRHRGDDLVPVLHLLVCTGAASQLEEMCDGPQTRVIALLER